MVNEDLVVACVQRAQALGLRFACYVGRRTEGEDWKASALFEMVCAGADFKRREIVSGSHVAMFWTYAKERIWNRMIDQLRAETARGRIAFVELPGSLSAEWPGEARIGARMAIESARPWLTAKEREVIDADLAGVDLGRSYHAHRCNALRKMREVLCG